MFLVSLTVKLDKIYSMSEIKYYLTLVIILKQSMWCLVHQNENMEMCIYKSNLTDFTLAIWDCHEYSEKYWRYMNDISLAKWY